jgi:hypothetical protein
MEFLTGPLRPLEQTRDKWNTEENLELYFAVARDLLLDAGVAIINPDFDPTIPYSQEILIIHPERICSYDETKMELDCTRAGRGNTDRTIRDTNKDDGTTLVTKSSKCGTAVCGRLGDGRSLPCFVCFASGDSFQPSWTPHYVSDEVFDKNGDPLEWRYISNVKGSMTEEFCCIYIEDVLYPALGYPKHRDTHPGHQGVIVCDGVGTHLGYSVVKKAVDPGMEVMLRVPHLNYLLQGEDTMNFTVSYCPLDDSDAFCCFCCCRCCCCCCCYCCCCFCCGCCC